MAIGIKAIGEGIKSLFSFGSTVTKSVTKVKLAKSGDKIQDEKNASAEYMEMLKFRGSNSFNAKNRNWYDSLVDGLNRLVFPLTAFPFIYLLWRLVIKDPQTLLDSLGAAGLLTIIGTLLGVRQIGKKIALSKDVKKFVLPVKEKEVEIKKTDEPKKKNKKITTNSKIPKVIKFIEDYSDHALFLEEKYGLNALGVLSHAALETGWGEKILKGYLLPTKSKVDTNNIFNIKTGSSWTGKIASKNAWEDHNSNGKIDKGEYEKSTFRVYGNAKDSFIDYAKLLTTKERYIEVSTARTPSEYGSSLLKCGYMTDGASPNKILLISRMMCISQ